MNMAWMKFFVPEVLRKMSGQGQNVVFNVIWLLGDKVLRLGVGLFVSVWVARYLGPEQFGVFNYALAFVALFSALATLGLDSIVVRALVRSPDAREEIIGTAFFLKLLGGGSVLFIAVSAVTVLRPQDSLSHWLVGIVAAGTIFQSFDVIDVWFQAQVKSKYVVYAKNSAFLAISIVKLALISLEAPLLAFAWAGFAEIIVGVSGLILAFNLQGHRVRAWSISSKRARDLLRDSWPLLLSDMVGMIYLRVDQVMLAQMLGDKDVGTYSVAVQLAEVWYFLPMIIYSSVLPSIIEARNVGDEFYYRRLQKIYNLMAFMGYAIAIPVSLCSGWIVEVLYGPSYAMAAPMLAGLVWAGLFVNLGVSRSLFLTSMNWTRLHFFTVLQGALLNVFLNMILIPVYGGMGAVISSICAYWFAAHGACFVLKPLHRTGFMLTKAIVYPKIW